MKQGKKAPMKTINNCEIRIVLGILAKMIYASGIQAKGGIGRSESIIGKNKLRNFLLQPESIPSGIANEKANAEATRTLHKLAAVCCNRVFPKTDSGIIRSSKNLSRTRCG